MFDSEAQSETRLDDIQMLQTHILAAVDDITRALESEHCDKVSKGVLVHVLHGLAPALRALNDRIIEKLVGEVVKKFTDEK
jgi:hypothetical protein